MAGSKLLGWLSNEHTAETNVEDGVAVRPIGIGKPGMIGDRQINGRRSVCVCARLTEYGAGNESQ